MRSGQLETHVHLKSAAPTCTVKGSWWSQIRGTEIHGNGHPAVVIKRRVLEEERGTRDECYCIEDWSFAFNVYSRINTTDGRQLVMGELLPNLKELLVSVVAFQSFYFIFWKRIAAFVSCVCPQAAVPMVYGVNCFLQPIPTVIVVVVPFLLLSTGMSINRN